MAEITAEDIAGKFKVSRRTIFRDLRSLARAGITFRYSHDERNYRADKPALLSHAEAMALLLALQHATRHPTVGDLEAAHSAAAKLAGILPPSIMDYCGRLLKRTQVLPGKVSDPTAIANVLPAMHHALAAQKKRRYSRTSRKKPGTSMMDGCCSMSTSMESMKYADGPWDTGTRRKSSFRRSCAVCSCGTRDERWTFMLQEWRVMLRCGR